MEEGRIYDYLMQDTAVVVTVNHFIKNESNILNEVFEDSLIRHRFCCVRSLGLSLGDLYLWENLKKSVLK
jgi:hypothetical protein